MQLGRVQREAAHLCQQPARCLAHFALRCRSYTAAPGRARCSAAATSCIACGTGRDTRQYSWEILSTRLPVVGQVQAGAAARQVGDKPSRMPSTLVLTLFDGKLKRAWEARSAMKHSRAVGCSR
jgi:hypothetical protein